MRSRAELVQKRPYLLPQGWPVICQAMQLQHILAQPAPDLLDWLFILHLDCVVRRNDCTISAMPIIIRWLYGTPNGCSVERDKRYIVQL